MKKTSSALIIVTIAIVGILSTTIAHQTVYAEDAYAKGQVDATRDYHGLNGHGYDDSCPSGHSAQYCANYKDGSATQWAVSANNDLLNGGDGTGVRNVDSSNSQSQGAAIGGNKINGDDNTVNQQIIQQQGSGGGDGGSLSHCKAFCVN